MSESREPFKNIVLGELSVPAEGHPPPKCMDITNWTYWVTNKTETTHRAVG